MKMRIVLKSFDENVLEDAAREIVSELSRAGADFSGPVPLPRHIQKITVNTSPHVNKKAREQFEIRTKSRLIVVVNPAHQVMSIFQGRDLPAGVDVMIKFPKLAGDSNYSSKPVSTQAGAPRKSVVSKK
ncbi:30S ribosomal protein S10 [Rickettsiales endosymbiont of Paramecium tredecaurelia]|nr:30S ribosomal protein S10 [Candidatus Sarmatiella mevalonica]